MNFCEIHLSDKERMDRYLKPWSMDNAECSFANLYMWRDGYRIRYCIEDEVLYLSFQPKDAEHPIFLPPFPGDFDGDYREPMRKLVKHCEECGIPFLLQSVNEKSADCIETVFPGDFVITEERDYSEYVYAVSDLINLSGKKYHKKRNHIARFLENNPDYEFAPIGPDDVDDCKEMYLEWYRARISEGMEDLEAEKTAMFEALDHMKELDLEGALVRIGGRVKAYTLGERVSARTALIHIEKADQEIQGLYPLINREFLKSTYSDMEFVNREEDMGLEGLRKAKMSYYPVHFIKKYTVTLKEGVSLETLRTR